MNSELDSYGWFAVEPQPQKNVYTYLDLVDGEIVSTIRYYINHTTDEP